MLTSSSLPLLLVPINGRNGRTPPLFNPAVCRTPPPPTLSLLTPTSSSPFCPKTPKPRAPRLLGFELAVTLARRRHRPRYRQIPTAPRPPVTSYLSLLSPRIFLTHRGLVLIPRTTRASSTSPGRRLLQRRGGIKGAPEHPDTDDLATLPSSTPCMPW